MHLFLSSVGSYWLGMPPDMRGLEAVSAVLVERYETLCSLLYMVAVVGYFSGACSFTLTIPASMYWPPPVCLQWIAMVFAPFASALTASAFMGIVV